MNEKIVVNSNQIITNFGEKMKNIDVQFNTIETKIDTEKINAMFPPKPYSAIVNGEDIAEKINHLLTNFKYVYIPNGKYNISTTINIPNDCILEMGKNCIITPTTNSNIFKLNNKSQILGGVVQTTLNFTQAVFYHTDISTYCVCKDTVIKGTTSGEIGTAVGILFDGSDSNKNGSNCYQMFNTYENIEMEWLGLGIKSISNNNSSKPWVTANTFNNIKMWHVHQIVDLDNQSGGNIFNNFITQSGKEDTLLYKCNGELNQFTNIIYYDLPSNCCIVEFGSSSRLNNFQLWFEYEGGQAKPIIRNSGNRNTFTKFGGYIETPTDLELKNGWVAPSGDYQKLQFYKSNLNEVRLRGIVTGGTVRTEIATLPYGYRPNKHLKFICSSGNDNFVVVTIHYNGVIMAYSDKNESISFDGVVFRTDY